MEITNSQLQAIEDYIARVGANIAMKAVVEKNQSAKKAYIDDLDTMNDVYEAYVDKFEETVEREFKYVRN